MIRFAGKIAEAAAGSKKLYFILPHVSWDPARKADPVSFWGKRCIQNIRKLAAARKDCLYCPRQGL